MRQYGVSVVSLFPWSLGPGGPKKTVQMAKSAGYDGIQALPLRGWGGTPLSAYETYVLAFEDAWNYGGFWEVPLRMLGVRPEGPTFLDWVLFRSPHSTSFANAIPSAHHMRLGVATEIHPELTTNVDDYVSFCEAGGKLCWDTWHVRRNRREGQPGIADWKDLLRQLPEDAIALIHVHLVKGEIESFFAGEGELVEMLAKLNETVSADVPVIIEIAPPMTTRSRTTEFLAQVREHTQPFLK